MRWNALRFVLPGVAVSLLTACDALTGGDDPEIALAVAPASTSVGQSNTTTLTVTVGRTNYKGVVNLNVQGLPAGISAVFSPPNLPNGVESSSLALTATALATPGDYTITVRASGDGVGEQSATVPLAITVTGDFSLAMLEPNTTVAQGGAGSATVLINRTGGYGGNVTLTVSGAPSGVSVSVNSSPTTGNGAALTLTATGAAPTGTHSLTVTATSPGLADRTTTFALQVIAPPSTATLTIPFCAVDDLPVWLAYRNEGYGWVRVQPTGTSFVFDATSRLALAYVNQFDTEYQTRIFYMTRAELSSFSATDCPGTKSLAGSVADLATGQVARVALGTSAATASATALSFSLTDVQDRALDLYAARATQGSGTFTPDKIIIRRAQTFADGAAIPTLDFASEGFAPQSNALTLTGLQAGDQIDVEGTLRSASVTYGRVFLAAPTSGSLTMYSVPSAQQIAGDLHELFVDAYAFGGAPGRGLFTFYTTPSDRSDALGPSLSSMSVSVVGTTPYVRLRGAMASQSQYNTIARAGFFQQAGNDVRFVIVAASAGYHGSLPTTWDLVVPDFGTVTGLNANWMLRTGSTEYFADAYSGRLDILFGAAPASGDLTRFAYLVASTTALREYRELGTARSFRRPQYLRR